MNIKKSMQLGLVSLLGLLPMVKAGGNVELKVSEEPASTAVEANAFYNLPGNINGFTFVDLYNEGGWFSKTSLEKEIAGGINARAVTVQANDLWSGFGLGVSYGTKISGINTKVNLMPCWFDEDGKQIDKSTIGLSLSKQLPHDINAMIWGEYDLENGNWVTGEFELSKSFGKIAVGYHPTIKADEKGHPELEHTAVIRYNF